MKKVSFYTLGCKVNQYETNAMAQKFKESGYEIVDMNDDISDICIVNTCTVTNMSDRKSRHSLRRVKEKNPSAIIAAVGCYAQVAKNDLENMPQSLGKSQSRIFLISVFRVIRQDVFDYGQNIVARNRRYSN